MSKVYTYSNPVLSLWQASVAEVHRRHASIQNRMGALPPGSAATPSLLDPDTLMAPAITLGEALKTGRSVATPTLSIAAHASLGSTLVDCAKTAGEFLIAEIKGNQQQSDILAGELKDSTCDIGWSECLITYLAYKASLSNLPYRPNLNPVIDLEQRTKLAIVGDWGTGDKVAINLLKELAKLSPDVLIHLGDVYYAGTHNEEQTNFLDFCRQVLGSNVVIVSLCGNHDMYSGGQGYYWLVDQLGQQASYFCLQNADWQFLAMDTGHNDNNPVTVGTNMTSLVTFGTWAEENWLLDKINLA
jgi:hypothetical protein